MCLVVFAWRVHADYPLILAANRDEFHGRPASPLNWWPDKPGVAAGRDLQAGGTWLAASRNGRFATVTNFREDLEVEKGDLSRGALVADFVTGDEPPLAYAKRIDGARFAGFSLLAATPDEMACVSNRGDPARQLAPGIYGLSNASLDTPWPKLTRSKKRLAALLDEDAVSAATLFELLSDRAPARAAETGTLPKEQVRAISAPFIVTPVFGTRCSTVLLLDQSGRVRLHERRFDAAGDPQGESSLDFRIVKSRARG